MSDADRISLAFVEETTYGVTPSGPAPTLKELRFTSESLAQQTSTVQSTEIRSDRQVVDIDRTNINVSGDLNYELSYDTYDDFLAAALLSAGWSSSVSTTTTDYSINSNQLTRTSGSWISDGYLTGQWVRISGFSTNPTNNGYFKIGTVATLTMNLSPIGGLTNESAGDSVTAKMGAQIVNGVSLTTYSIEKVFKDLTNIFAVYVGMAIDAFSMNVSPDNLVTGAFTFIGKSESSGTTTVGDGSNSAPPSGGVLNGVDNVKAIIRNSVVLPTTGFNFNLGNNLRTRLEITKLGPISIGTGKINLSGALTVYLVDNVIINTYLNMDTSSLALVVEDSDVAGDAYIVEFPAIKFTDGKRVAGGENTDIIADMTFEAFRDTTEGITMRIAKFGV